MAYLGHFCHSTHCIDLVALTRYSNKLNPCNFDLFSNVTVSTGSLLQFWKHLNAENDLSLPAFIFTPFDTNHSSSKRTCQTWVILRFDTINNILSECLLKCSTPPLKVVLWFGST